MMEGDGAGSEGKGIDGAGQSGRKAFNGRSEGGTCRGLGGN